jgi:GT2 family glycosyltransferase
MEHGPFALWLTEALRPRVLVELGTHTGFSYFSFCQAVLDFWLSTNCYAIDTWLGDEHAGFYGEEVFRRVDLTNKDYYAGFSRLLRCRFDDALPHFSDGEIDLLHIDGRHRYEDVKHDFETWRPKLSSRGVVLFHDTNVRVRDFGVWKLWQELSCRHPSFEFQHGHGLGVLAVGPDVPRALRPLFDASEETRTDIGSAYSRLGSAITTERALLQSDTELNRQNQSAAQTRRELELEIERLRRDGEQISSRSLRFEQKAIEVGRKLSSTESKQEQMQDELSAATRDLEAIRRSTFWRATGPMRGLLSMPAARPVRAILRGTARALYRTAKLQRCLVPPTAWYARYRRDVDYSAINWRGSTRFSILMPVYKVRPKWLERAIASVLGQTYPHWELICVDDCSQNPRLTAILNRAAAQDPRVRSITLDRNQGVSSATNAALEQATGDYVLFMDHDDLLEPHALARLGDAAYQEDGDLLFGDEVVTGKNADDILDVRARPSFSHSYYLSHPFFVHPIAARLTLARKIGGLDISLKISQDIDFVLRMLEVAKKVTQVPDILYRWRNNIGSAGHTQMSAVMSTTCAVKTAHLRRIGFPDAEVTPGRSFNTFKVRYFDRPTGRVLVIIPTKNHGDILKVCVESVFETTKGLELDLVIVDHESADPATLTYLETLESGGRARVLPYIGLFNYGAINNRAVLEYGSGYDYFLFMNNDIEATKTGWLDGMVDLAMRADVGAVGATLLYPDGSVQHSGVIVGLKGTAEHAFKTVPFRSDEPGYGAGLHATREYSAVTAACMLVPATAFNAVGGFDEDLEVGFNDTDLCLRIGSKGYRIINCADAVLLHHESATRGRDVGFDPHPADSALFVSRYADFMRAGDPHFSSLLDPNNPTIALDPAARMRPYVTSRSVSDFLPKNRRTRPVDPQ